MSQIGETTRLSVGGDAAGTTPGQRVLRAVQEAVSGEYEVLGELGRNDGGVTVFLARQLRLGVLVALRARPADGPAGASGEMWLDVLRQLDATTPGPREACVSCGQSVSSWDRFCGHCGVDLTGAQAGDGTSADQLLQAVRDAAGVRYDVLGQMDRADGGGNVYFARERGSGKLTALRLRREAGSGVAPQYSLGRTTVLKSVAESLGVVHGGPPPAVARPPVSAAPAVPIAVTPPPPVPPPAVPAELTDASPGVLQRYALPIAVAAAIVVLAGAFVLAGRRGTPASGADSASASGPMHGSADSVQVTIGGSLPPGTIITVDGEVVAPPTFSLRPGKHTFRAAAPGYAAAMQSLTLAAGQRMMWTPTIAPATLSRTSDGSARRAASTARANESPGVQPGPELSAAGHAAPSSPAPSAPATPRDATHDSTLANLPTTTSNPTCASLFSTLEWDRALPICQREAAGGSIASERTLGTLYDRGLGTEPNPKQAVVWYQRAADAGDRVAQYRLGVLKRDGKGIRQDQKGAVDLFHKSADQGDADAQSAMGTAFERGEGVKRDYVQAADWYRKAANQGHPGAAYRLGVFYAQGKGVSKSDSAAIAWWQKAAAEGEPAARAALAKGP